MTFKPRVLVDYEPDDTVVYVEKSTGGFVAVYVGEVYEYDRGFAIRTDSSGNPRATKVFG